MTTDTTIIQARNTVLQLQQLVARMGARIDQQQRTLLDSRADQVKQIALRNSGELTRMLMLIKRSAEELEKRIQEQAAERDQLRALQQVGAAINSSLERDLVLSEVMDVIIQLTQAERAMLLLINRQDGRLEVQVARNMDRETIEQSESFQISRSIVRRVAETGEPVATMNAQEDDRFSAQQSIISYKLRSILCVPLKIKDTITGVIYADNRIADGIFSDTDRDLLAAFANQAAVAIENARLFREIQDHLAEITEMKELMDNVFASITSGVITIDEADRIALYNHAAEHILGVPRESALREAYETVLNVIGPPVGDLVRDVKLNGDAQNAELDVYLGKTDQVTTLNMKFSPLRDVQQAALGVAMVLDDVSEKKRLESVRRYLPPKLVDQIRDLDAAQRPQRREMSVLFADVRGFSTYSEHLDPELLVEIINGYFTVAVQAITQYQGLTDKFMGDAVMALFNTPLNPQQRHVERAVRTALMMQKQTAVYHASLPPDRRLHFGIGIHTGEAVVGNVGSAARKDYSAIGDAVNLAKRLQEIARPDQIVISHAAYASVQDVVVVESLPPVQVKGRQAFEQLYVLRGLSA